MNGATASTRATTDEPASSGDGDWFGLVMFLLMGLVLGLFVAGALVGFVRSGDDDGGG